MKAPFPYFGNKTKAAPLVWDAFGDPSRYIEPFAGACGVLLGRPPHHGRRDEIVNDADGWLVNFWRAVQLRPADVHRHFDGWPVTEIDLAARRAWLQQRRDDRLTNWLAGDPEHCDPKAAAWWLYVVSASIAAPMERGPWHVVDGHLTKTVSDRNGVVRGLPYVASRGKGAHLLTSESLSDLMGRLSRRLRHVRITCGDWARVLTPVMFNKNTLTTANGDGSGAVLLDPPYTTGGDVYDDGDHGTDVSPAVTAWCEQADPTLRIVVCGYLDEHDRLLDHGWRKIDGARTTPTFRNGDTRRERLWLSPACIEQQQLTLHC